MKSVLQLNRELEQRQAPTRRSPQKAKPASRLAFPPDFTITKSKKAFKQPEIRPKTNWWKRYKSAVRVRGYIEIDAREFYHLPPYAKESGGV